MAVDTANKRASVLAYRQPFLPAVWPTPDTSIAGQADRQHVSYSYPGILVSGVVTPSVFGDLTTLFVGYVHTLRNANPTKVDSDTLVAKDLSTVRAATTAANLDDANTMYADYLS